MLSISKICCEIETEGDVIRYGQKIGAIGDDVRQYNLTDIPKKASERRPVVVWNVTRSCNLSCIHCYSNSENKIYQGELTTNESKSLIDDLSSFKIPALLLSGGEPLLRKDIFELIDYAKRIGLRITLSTNGTLITEAIAQQIKSASVDYVGISLDGIGEVNDRFRGIAGAFKRAISGFRNCISVGQKVGLRMTLTCHNYKDLHSIFDLIERENINRACFYHLVYAGRGSQIIKDDITHQEKRQALDIIIERTIDFHKRGLKKDILTVDNPVDGVYLYLKLRESNLKKAEYAFNLLEWNGGGLNGSGVGIGCVDAVGDVHPDQFWTHYKFGNIRQRRFSEIWMDISDPLMAGLKNRRKMIKGRCAECKWFSLCGGGLRVRADVLYGDLWAPDPACYLTDKEIGGFI